MFLLCISLCTGMRLCVREGVKKNDIYKTKSYKFKFLRNLIV